jgi:hypothetical protein
MPAAIPNEEVTRAAIELRSAALEFAAEVLKEPLDSSDSDCARANRRLLRSANRYGEALARLPVDAVAKGYSATEAEVLATMDRIDAAVRPKTDQNGNPPVVLDGGTQTPERDKVRPETYRPSLEEERLQFLRELAREQRVARSFRGSDPLRLLLCLHTAILEPLS